MTPGMQRRVVEQIVNAVLYEGYILYPYRPSSVKNQQRWTFGGIYPQAYRRAQGGSEPCMLQTECLVVGHQRTVLDVRVRFLHLVDRTVGELATPIAEMPALAEPAFRLVESLRVGDRLFTPWQEAVEREIDLCSLELAKLAEGAQHQPISFPAARQLEPITGPSGEVVGVIVRRQVVIEGTVTVAAQRLEDGLFRIAVRVENVTPPDLMLVSGSAMGSRDAALLQALVSAHVILSVRDGEFVSLLDPPERYGQAAAQCSNVGVWPVLVGAAGSADTMLASPIILYDYPEVAPESPGDLFDGTEIDEILTLRILAMTDAEKEEMRQTDERSRAVLERTEQLQPEQLAQLHGVMRNPRPVVGRAP